MVKPSKSTLFKKVDLSAKKLSEKHLTKTTPEKSSKKKAPTKASTVAALFEAHNKATSNHQVKLDPFLEGLGDDLSNIKTPFYQIKVHEFLSTTLHKMTANHYLPSETPIPADLLSAADATVVSRIFNRVLTQLLIGFNRDFRFGEVLLGFVDAQNRICLRFLAQNYCVGNHIYSSVTQLVREGLKDSDPYSETVRTELFEKVLAYLRNFLKQDRFGLYAVRGARSHIEVESSLARPIDGSCDTYTFTIDSCAAGVSPLNLSYSLPIRKTPEYDLARMPMIGVSPVFQF